MPLNKFLPEFVQSAMHDCALRFNGEKYERECGAAGSEAACSALEAIAWPIWETMTLDAEVKNKELQQLIQQTFGLKLADVYATNLFPFVKLGGMSGKIKQRDLVRAARIFAIPQIRIVQPALVICLGLDSYNALREAELMPAVKPISLAIETPFPIGESMVWCQAHTGSRGQNNQKKKSAGQVTRDWGEMKDWFMELNLPPMSAESR